MATAIKVENLSKIYRLGEIGTGTISRDIERFVKTKILKQDDPFLKIGETIDRAAKGTSDIVYSLKDINFNIEQGDAVGIIGRNGAGKSTLLKILSRVTSPTTGKINIKGRVASLLEVGTGFHPELTGRENIYLNGAILGMRKREIDRKLDEIIDFSGVERYIDTPVKRYSSGMYVRLAFAVAAHLESEILIVDEVLAVGDAEFQKKCLGKMGEVSKGEGRTVLFVSHNLGAVKQLCNKGVLLSAGQVIGVASVNKVISDYSLSEMRNNNSFDINFENNELIVSPIRISQENAEIFLNTSSLSVSFLISSKIKLSALSGEFFFETDSGAPVFSYFTPQFNMIAGSTKKIEICIPPYLFNELEYVLSFGISESYSRFLMKKDSALKFKVTCVNDEYGWMGEFPGVIRPKITYQISQYDSEDSI
jgi:lipopolysaccharide transport system ATP-binding protein